MAKPYNMNGQSRRQDPPRSGANSPTKRAKKTNGGSNHRRKGEEIYPGERFGNYGWKSPIGTYYGPMGYERETKPGSGYGGPKSKPRLARGDFPQTLGGRRR